MTETTGFDLDETGKIDLSDIYDQPDPRRYYQTLTALNYQIPAMAAPVFETVVAARRQSQQRNAINLLDVGSSYGVNAAILRHGVDLSNLFHLYDRASTGALSRSALVARDRRYFAQSRVDRQMKIFGLDIAGEALDYAEEIGILDAGLTADLEARPPAAREKELLGPIDLVISTGAIGYVGVPTFSRILDCATASPWFALFALRMFPVDEIAAMLRARGYLVYRQRGRTYRQRRFAGEVERREVLARLEGLGIDPQGYEADGWYHAEFYFAWPAEETAAPPIENLSPI